MRLTKVAVMAAAVIAGWGAAAPTAGAQPADTQPAEAPKTTIDADGTYTVGTEIVPGVYQSAGPVDGGACYWKRAAGEEMLDNRLTKKPSFVQILPTDTTFTTSDCQAWQLTNAPMPPQPGPGELLGQLTQAIGSGMFSGGPR